jgi:hypothetical protein
MSNLTKEVSNIPLYKLRKVFHDKLKDMNAHIFKGTIDIFDSSTLDT